MKAPNKDQLWTGFIITLIVVGGGTGLGIAGYQNPVYDAVQALGAWLFPGAVTPGQPVRVTTTVYKMGAESTNPAATGYVWYDWDGDGLVDIGNVDSGAGEIETLSASSGVITTNTYYPVSGDIYVQLHASSYEVVTYKRTVPSPALGWDGTTAIPIGNMPMVALDASGTVTVVATGTSAVAMVTSSGDYNYTTYGTSPSIDININCPTSDSGIGTESYTHWGTGKGYHGTFLAIKFVLTEKANLIFSDYDYIFDDGTSQWICWDIPSIFNDADLTDDGTYTKEFSLTIVGAFDWDEINVYNQVLETNFGQGSFGTQDYQETDLDFTA